MNDLMHYIDLINEQTDIAELSVLDSLQQAYTKACTILEASDETTDLSSFDMFQEGERLDKIKNELNSPILGNKGESVAKRILMIIPRLIAKIVSIMKHLVGSIIKKIRKSTKNIDKIDQKSWGIFKTTFKEKTSAGIFKTTFKEAFVDYTRKAASKSGVTDGFHKIWAPLSDQEKKVFATFIENRLISSSYDIEKLNAFFRELSGQLLKVVNSYYNIKQDNGAEFFKNVTKADTYIREIIHQDFPIKLDAPTKTFTSTKHTYSIDQWNALYDNFDSVISDVMSSFNKLSEKLETTYIGSFDEHSKTLETLKLLSNDLRYVQTLITDFSNEQYELQKIVEKAQAAYDMWKADNKQYDRDLNL